MALAVFRSCVMSRIAMGVTGKLKATCLKKPVYNKFGDRDVLGCLDQFKGNTYTREEWDACDGEEYGNRYANEDYDSDEEERRAIELEMTYWIPDDFSEGGPVAKFKYVSHGLYLYIPRPPIGRREFSRQQRPPFLVPVSDDGCAMFPVPRHHYEKG